LEEGLAKSPTVKVDEGDFSLFSVIPLAVEKPVKVRSVDPEYEQQGDS